jgi:hypothetical protein
MRPGVVGTVPPPVPGRGEEKKRLAAAAAVVGEAVGVTMVRNCFSCCCFFLINVDNVDSERGAPDLLQ